MLCRNLIPSWMLILILFFIKDQNTYTSGGVSSGIDLALALVKEDFGISLASEIARHLVLHLKRPGLQSQFGHLLPDYEMMTSFTREIRDLLKDKLSRTITIEYMAQAVHMSVRNFSGYF